MNMHFTPQRAKEDRRAEETVIGKLILDGSVYRSVSPPLAAEHFSQPYLRDIWNAVAKIHEQNGGRVTINLLESKLPSEWEGVGSVEAVLAITAQKARDDSSASDYVDQLIEAHEQRLAFEGVPSQPRGVHATPYIWRDPSTIPPREWLYGRLLIRRFLTATIAPGGIGKSSLIAAEALAMVSAKPLLGVSPTKPLSVWVWNLEDPQEETYRKIQAVALHFGLQADSLADRLYVDSGRAQPLVMATMTRNGTTIVRPVVDNLIAEVVERRIDVIVIDPFVSSHEVSENDNGAMDMIAKEWGKVADRGNCAVHLVHHTRKGEAEVTTESSRGGKALTDACRVVRAVNRMTKEEAERAGVENNRLYFRTFNDKANLAPPVEQSDWFKLESVDLGNGHLGVPGDSVGVAIPWAWPNAFDGVSTADLFSVQKAVATGNWKQDHRAKDWVGHAVIETLNLNADNAADRSRVRSLLKTWIETGALKVVRKADDSRHERPFVEVGTWANT